MTRTEAEALYQLVHSKLWTVYIDYKTAELNKLRDTLEWQRGDEAAYTQGRVAEIREEFALKGKVNNFFENN